MDKQNRLSIPADPPPGVTQDWPRTPTSTAPDDVREWVHEVPPRYYLHRIQKGEHTGKWVVIDRVYDLADGCHHRRKADCIRAFVRAHDKRSADLPPIEDLAVLLAEEPPPSRVVIDPDNETATLHYAYPYEIDLDRIRTPADLLNWTMHLVKKAWMDAERLHEVVEAIATHKGFDLRLH